MTLADPLLGRIGVQPEERGLFGWAFLCLLLIGAAAVALLNTAETLFLKRVGVDSLPLVLLLSAGLLVASTAAVGRFASADPGRWLPRILVGLGLALIPFALFADSRSPIVVGVLLLVSRQVLALGVLGFWLALGSLVAARRAKQIFAPLAAGLTAGGILGSFGSEPVARVIGVDGLMGACALSLGGAAIVGARLRHSGTRLDRALVARTGRPIAAETGLFDLLRGSRLFGLLAVALFCGGVLNPVFYFEFATVVDAATQGPDGEQRLLDLYAQFRGWLNVAMLVSQLWLSKLLFRRIGMPLSLALWPAAYLLGLTWLGLDFALHAALVSWGLAQVSEDGVSDSAARVLYNLLPEGVRSHATGLLEGPINRLGALLGNGFVLGAVAIGATAWVGWAVIPLGGLWLASGLVLWRAYPGLLLRASSEHGLAGAGIDRATLLDPATLRSLAASLVAPDPRVCRAAVDLMVDGEPRLVVPLFAEAVEHAPASNRPLLVETLHRLVESLAPGGARSDQAAQALARSLRAQPPLPAEERADLVQVYARLTGGDDAPEAMLRESNALLQRALGDRASMVRLAAVAELHRRGAPPPGLPDLDRTLAEALAASDALIRRAARKELRAMLLASDAGQQWMERLGVLARHLDHRADRAETAEALREVARRHGARTEPIATDALHYSEDRDPRVRGALLAVAGHAGLADESSRLVAALGVAAPEVAAGAHEGLVALGPAAVPSLLVGLEFGGPARREASLAVLRELEVDAATIDSLRARQLEEVRATVVCRTAIDDVPGVCASLLCRRLEERVSEGLGALLDLLSALYEEPRLAELERRLRRSSGGSGRELLVEAIEALLGHGDREAIVPLLEPGEWGPRGEAAARALGRPRPDPAQALAELRESPDITTSILARPVSVDGTAGIGDPTEMPAAMEIAVRLQDVPAFDRLSTQQLMALADHLQEQKVMVGECIYRAGEEGSGLYFVLEGEVELRRGSLVVDRAAPGAFFGLLSALDGVPRSADAVASREGRLMRLDRDDLLPLLEEVPRLAIGLAQVLSARVRRLEDRLEDASSPGAEPS